jgi:Putative lumazine-binding
MVGGRISRRDARPAIAVSVESTAADLASAKVRVRIGQTGFVDHLIFHRIDGKWLVTAKAFHVARIFPAGS